MICGIMLVSVLAATNLVGSARADANALQDTIRVPVVILSVTMSKGEKDRPVKEPERRAIKVPGGWKLPGDATVYPFNPLVPPDQVNPVPSRPDRRLRKRPRQRVD
jgi:hypothetical protein